MKKPSIRKNRFKKIDFTDTSWTKSSKSLGEYIFRRLSLDQSNSKLKNVRPRHCLSKLIISSSEIDQYVNDYLILLSQKNEHNEVQKTQKKNQGIDRYFTSSSMYKS